MLRENVESVGLSLTHGSILSNMTKTFGYSEALCNQYKAMGVGAVFRCLV